MHDLWSALGQAWSPFVLVCGLLLIGVAAAVDGLFEAAGALLARVPGDGRALFVAVMALVAATTVILNLDTSVVFLTPIALETARQRAIDERAFLYGTVFMSNSASLLLPGSNLTNLLVFSPRHVAGAVFAARVAPAWVAAVVITTAVVGVWRRKDLRTRSTERHQPVDVRVGLGLISVVAAATLVIVLNDAAIPVFAIGIIVVTSYVAKHRLSRGAIFDSLNVLVLFGLFALAVGLGTLARTWNGPAHLIASAPAVATTLIGAGTAVVVNNLPATVLFSARPLAHPVALLLGLDLGPNVVVTGALSAVLWLRVARKHGASPSVSTYSKVGSLIAIASIGTAVGALLLLSPHTL